jgi:Tfp pilus assembly protein PilV
MAMNSPCVDGKGVSPCVHIRSTLRRRLEAVRRDEGGIMLIEVLVSSMLLVVVALGVFTAFDATSRSTAQERHKARASAIADADQSRMRTMRIADLANLNETTTVNQDGTNYTVVSKAEFSNEPATTSACQTGLGSRDYIKISSTVTWPGIGSANPVVASSLVTPPSGSVVPNSGSLTINVIDSQAVGKSGIGVNGSGPASFSGTTGPTGCVSWSNLPAGNYNVNLTNAGGLVDPDGVAPTTKVVSVVADSTNTVSFQYDTPGEIPIRFRKGTSSSAFSTDSVIISNTGMSTPKTVGTPGGTRFSQTTAQGLFPFTSSYGVYAYTCDQNNPNPADAVPAPVPGAIPYVTVPRGGTSPIASIQLPWMNLTVRTGSSSSSQGSLVNGAAVLAYDVKCDDFPRQFSTGSSGTVSDPETGTSGMALPYSDYRVWARAVISGTPRCNWVRVWGSWGTDPIETLNLDTSSAVSSGVSDVIYLTGEGASTWSGCPAP